VLAAIDFGPSTFLCEVASASIVGSVPIRIGILSSDRENLTVRKDFRYEVEFRPEILVAQPLCCYRIENYLSLLSHIPYPKLLSDHQLPHLQQHSCSRVIACVVHQNHWQFDISNADFASSANSSSPSRSRESNPAGS